MSKKKQDKNEPIDIWLSDEQLEKVDHAMGIHCALNLVDTYHLPKEGEYYTALYAAFCNGISFARQWEGLTPEQRAGVKAQYEPLFDEYLKGDDTPEGNGLPQTPININ